MRKIWKRTWLAGAALALAWLLGGCAAPSSAESLFTLPQLPIEYTDLSRQINDLFDQGYEYASPSSGRNIQSVQMVDLDGDGDEEAVAFFRNRGNDEKPLKIFVFRANDDTYELLCTIESSGTGVDSVFYQDLTGDGRLELVVGWRISSEVQTVAAYEIGPEPVMLMQSGYVRYSIEELDGDGVPSLLIFRLNDEGNSVAEFYSWSSEKMSVSFSTNLSGTMAELARGSVVSGRVSGRQAAVFVTGVTEENMAATDIITYREGQGLVNLALNSQTGSSRIVYPYMQLRPQDINNDGVTDVPCPRADEDGQLSGLVDWMDVSGENEDSLVMTTYHHVGGGWYFMVPMDWANSIQVSNAEHGVNEVQTMLLLNGDPVGTIYTLTGENRENRALRGNRIVLKRQTGTIYAAELYAAGERYGLTEELLRQNFRLISNQWISG